MPPYQTSPSGNNPVKTLQPGVNGYAFGSRDGSFPTTLMQITNVSLTGNVATYTVLIREGKIPLVGALLTVTGTTVSSGAFNVTAQPIATVSIDSVTGVGTITITLVHGDVVSAPDNGMGYVPVPEVGETLANGSSQAFALPDEAGHNTNGITITMSVSYPSAPSTVTATLQSAMVDVDSEYASTGLALTSTSPAQASINLRLYRFLRVVWSNVTGGSSPTGIVRLSI